MRPALVVLAALVLAGCGSSSPSSTSTSTSSSSSAPAAGTQVSMKGLAFTPATVHAKVGETITFVNDDTPAHNVEPDGGVSFHGSSTIQPSQTFKLHLTKAGTIQYLCSIHPFMKGTIVVSP